MIPVRDSIPHQRRPLVTLSLIVVCVGVFVYELTLGTAGLALFVDRWGAIPQLILGALNPVGRISHVYLLTLLSSQFLHAGVLHLAGNMVFLWVFGRAVENRLGSFVYLLFYLVSGSVAALAQCIVSGPGETVPLIGASGAIAGVLGLYFVSYPRAWVTMLVPVLFFFWAFDLPAVLVLAFWFASQAFNGLAALSEPAAASSVAVWAHVTGFALGVAAWKLPRPQAAAAGARISSTAEGPGPGRLIASLADLAGALLLARVFCVFFGLAGSGNPLRGFADPILGATALLVAPFARLIAPIPIGPFVLEADALVAAVVIYILAGLLAQIVLRRERGR